MKEARPKTGTNRYTTLGKRGFIRVPRGQSVFQPPSDQPVSQPSHASQHRAAAKNSYEQQSCSGLLLSAIALDNFFSNFPPFSRDISQVNRLLKVQSYEYTTCARCGQCQ